MQKIQAFWYIMKNSLLAPDYYAQLKDVKISFSLRFLAISVFVTAFLSSLFQSFTLSRDITFKANEYVQEILKLYPEGMEITMENGKWEINKEMPIIIQIPEGIKKLLGDHAPENLLIIDKNGVVDDLKNKNSLFLMNENNLVIDNNGQIQSNPLSQIPNGKLDYQTFTTQIEKLKVWAKYLPLISLSFNILGSAVSLFYVSVLLGGIGVIFLMIWSFILKMGLDFGFTTKLSIHGLVIPFVVHILVVAFYAFGGNKVSSVNPNYFSAVIIFMYLAFLGVVLRSLHKFRPK